MLRAVLLDLDDTVYEYEPCHREGLLHAHTVAAFLKSDWLSFETFAHDYSQARKQVQNRIAGTAASHSRLLYFKELLEGRGIARYLAKAEDMNQAYWTGYASAMTPFPGCQETLEYLREQGVGLAWVTNFVTERQIFKLQRLAMDEFGILLTSEDCGKDKPKTDLFELALTKLKVPASHAVMIGDNYQHDIAPAKRLGLSALWLARGQSARFSRVPVCADWPQILVQLKQLIHAPRKKVRGSK